MPEPGLTRVDYWWVILLMKLYLSIIPADTEDFGAARKVMVRSGA